MTTTITHPPRSSRRGPVWELASLHPDQGDWDEEEYLALETNRLIEFTDGIIEVLAMPKTSHQYIVAALYELVREFVAAAKAGTVLFAPLRIRLRPGLIREPDIVFMSADHADRVGEDYWDGADLVMEVVSDDSESRKRDLVRKRREYARYGVREYWIVDPRDRQILVYKLVSKRYIVHGRFGIGETAGSALLKGFRVDVSSIFAAGRGKR